MSERPTPRPALPQGAPDRRGGSPGIRWQVAPRFADPLIATEGVPHAILDRICDEAVPSPGGRGSQRLWTDRSGGLPTIRIRSGRRGGVLAHRLGDRYACPNRVLREFQLWIELTRRGAPLPEPVFARARREGLFWRSELATIDRPDAVDAGSWLDDPRHAAQHLAGAAAVALALRHFHDAGAEHGDLHLGNLLLESHAGRWECLLIDLDRSRRRPTLAPRDRMRDVMRLVRSFEKTGRNAQLTKRLQARFLAAYCAGDRVLRNELLSFVPAETRRIARHRFAWRRLRPGPKRPGRPSGSALLMAFLPALLALPLLLGTTHCRDAESSAGDRAPGSPIPEAAATRFSLLAVGDTGRAEGLGPFESMSEGQFAVAEAMTRTARQDPVDGLVLLGDNFYWHGLERAHLVERIRINLVRPYCHFLRLAGPRSEEVAGACLETPSQRRPVPIYAVLGNHDLELPESVDLQRHAVRDFLPDWRIGNDGLAEVVELGHGISLILFESEVAIRDKPAMHRALQAAIAGSRGPWRILATHRPIATDDLGLPPRGGYPKSLRDAIAGMAVRQREASPSEAVVRHAPVQLVLSGHHHNLQAFALPAPTPLLQIGAGSGARAEPPLAPPDHPDLLFGAVVPGFARVDLVGEGPGERLSVSLYEAPRWPWLFAFRETRLLARFEVDREGRVEIR